MRTITLEEHFATPAFLDGPLKELKESRHAARAAKLIAQLCDLGEGRLPRWMPPASTCRSCR